MENGKNPKQMNPLTLAFLGDAVYELYARRYVVERENCPVGQMHLKTVDLVNAGAQSAAFARLENFLSEEELAIYKRGRNTNTQSTPKHADIADYRRATGVEALFGYLFLKGETARAEELFALSIGAAAYGGEKEA